LNRERVIAALREHEPELKAAGIAHRALHGSYARGAEISAQSDVDVIAGVHIEALFSRRSGRYAWIRKTLV